MVSPDIFTAVTATVAAGFVTFIWWRIKLNLNEFKEEVLKVKKELREALYNRDGSTIYMSHHDCDRSKGACRLAVCAKIDRIELALNEMDRKRESAKESTLKQTAEIMRALGRLEASIQKDKST